VEKLSIEVRPAGRGLKAEVRVRDSQGAILLSDRCDLASIEGRQRAAKGLCAKLREKGLERAPEQIEAALETQWNKVLEAQDQPPEPDAPAAGADDLDAEEQHRLDETPPGVRSEAEALLKDPRLLAWVVEGIEAVGVAGEKELGATLYHLGTSRKLPRPLAGLVKGPSSSGKSYLIETVAGLFPPEGIIRATQMTPQALFHMPPGALRHRWIVAGERSRKQDDDTAEATRALREMISSGRLSKLMPVKLGHELQTQLIEQEGPIAFVESTTLEQVFEEDENRLVQLYTDERPEQTRLVIRRLAAASAGQAAPADVERVVQTHHALQRLLRRRPVVIPYAERLGELIPDTRVEARRAFPHLLTMIQASALLHQYQRAQDPAGRVIADRDDYRVAARLLHGAMRRLLGGGVGEPAQRFYQRPEGWFGREAFTTKKAKDREKTGRTGVYAWLQELHRAGAIEQVEAPRGPKPATWKLGEGGIDALNRSVLPSEGEVFGE
jgi:hypothetical protein